MSYQQKYLKYKKKYLDLKNIIDKQNGGWYPKIFGNKITPFVKEVEKKAKEDILMREEDILMREEDRLKREEDRLKREEDRLKKEEDRLIKEIMQINNVLKIESNEEILKTQTIDVLTQNKNTNKKILVNNIISKLNNFKNQPDKYEEIINYMVKIVYKTDTINGDYDSSTIEQLPNKHKESLEDNMFNILINEKTDKLVEIIKEIDNI